jgi:hypothetical protein
MIQNVQVLYISSYLPQKFNNLETGLGQKLKTVGGWAGITIAAFSLVQSSGDADLTLCSLTIYPEDYDLTRLRNSQLQHLQKSDRLVDRPAN